MITISRFLLIGALLISVSDITAGELPPIESVVDVRKAEKDSLSSMLVHHLFWPKKMLRIGTVDRQRIAHDVSVFSSLLQSRIRKDYLPQESLTNITDGVLAYFEKDDYLFTRYVTAKGDRVAIQDGYGLFVLIEPRQNDGPSTNLAQYVHDMAVSVIAYPESIANSNIPSVFTSNLNVGSSKVGRLYGTSEIRLMANPKTWYQVIEWWSDGTRM